MADAIDEAIGADQLNRHRPAEAKPKQAIEPGEMVHMGMRDENMADAKDLARSKRMEVAEIEEDRATAEPKIDQKARIRGRIIDEPCLNEPRHRLQ